MYGYDGFDDTLDDVGGLSALVTCEHDQKICVTSPHYANYALIKYFQTPWV